MDNRTSPRNSISSSSTNRISNDLGNEVDPKGPQIKKAIPPVGKPSGFSAKALLGRLISIVKPQFMRRQEVAAVWKNADLKTYEFLQAVQHEKGAQAVDNAMAEVIRAVAPLHREKEGTPDIMRLVGSRMLKQIREMNLNELGSLEERLENAWRPKKNDGMQLFLFSVRAMILHKQAYAIQKKVNVPLFEPGASIKASALSKDVLTALAGLHEDAKALLSSAKDLKTDEVLPGSQLKKNRLLLIEHWTREALDQLKKQELAT